MLPASHLEPGVVQAHASPITGILDIGRYPGGEDETARAIAGALRESTFSSEARPDIMRWKYCKLLMNLANAVEAVCAPSDAAGSLARRVRREGTACLQAAGIDFATREEDAARRGDLLQLGPIAGAMRGGGSSWQSLARESGRIETDYLTGEIVLLGRVHGVPTPANALLQAHAARLARTRAAPGSVDAAALLAELGDQPDVED
jgi:2-dehydropantoate 2-reductase